jgi:GxxExxY protein
MNHKDTKGTKGLPSEIEQSAYALIGAAVEVHRSLGPGFLESAYESALAIELKERAIRFERQVPIPLFYKGHCIADARLDLLIEGQVIAELKAVDALVPIHLAQALSYLKAMNLRLALLINFNVPVLRDGIRRVIRDEH